MTQQGINWNHCGPLSSTCRRFFEAHSCYSHCDPYQAPWKDPSSSSSFLSVPLCADYCDAWFEACKEELTCGINWKVDLPPFREVGNSTFEYECPRVSFSSSSSSSSPSSSSSSSSSPSLSQHTSNRKHSARPLRRFTTMAGDFVTCCGDLISTTLKTLITAYGGIFH